jgi:hypothetical protein
MSHHSQPADGYSQDQPRRHGQGAGHEHRHGHHHDGAHGHTHGLVDRSIVRSRAGIRAVLVSLGVLGATALIQTVIFVATGSVALLADLVHNFGDAVTAIPVGIAFLLRSFRAEKIAGLFVVAAIFISACFALYARSSASSNPRSSPTLVRWLRRVSSAFSGTRSPLRYAFVQGASWRAPR